MKLVHSTARFERRLRSFLFCNVVTNSIQHQDVPPQIMHSAVQDQQCPEFWAASLPLAAPCQKRSNHWRHSLTTWSAVTQGTQGISSKSIWYCIHGFIHSTPLWPNYDCNQFVVTKQCYFTSQAFVHVNNIKYWLICDTQRPWSFCKLVSRWNSLMMMMMMIQLRMSQPSILACMGILIQVGHISHILQVINTADRLCKGTSGLSTPLSPRTIPLRSRLSITAY